VCEKVALNLTSIYTLERDAENTLNSN
jgi:hypothetical protein